MYTFRYCIPIYVHMYLQGTPIIMIPASKGFSMICELLLENGANPNMKNKVIIHSAPCDAIIAIYILFSFVIGW